MKNKDKYLKETVDYVTKIEKSIKDSCGKIPQEYEMPLTMLADNYNIYAQARDLVIEKSIVIYNNDGTYHKNPMIKVMQDAQTQINRLLNQFGGTMLSKSKIKIQSQPDTSDDFFNEYSHESNS